jgi:hypothetical protein
MKVTLITGPNGELVATQLGHSGQIGIEAGLVAGPGQQLNVVTVPDELTEIKDPREFHYAMVAHLAKGKE